MSPSYGAPVSAIAIAMALPSSLPPSGRVFRIRSDGSGIRSRVSRILGSFQFGGKGVVMATAKPRKVEQEFYEDDDDDHRNREALADDSDNLVLLVQLVRNMLRKTSVRATKAVRGMLPPIFSSDLISFFVNGALLLTVFWVAKALLEVVCSMGGMMFCGLLLVRSVWSILTYLQSQRYEDESRVGNSSGNNGSTSSTSSTKRTNGGFDDHQYRTS